MGSKFQIVAMWLLFSTVVEEAPDKNGANLAYFCGGSPMKWKDQEGRQNKNGEKRMLLKFLSRALFSHTKENIW